MEKWIVGNWKMNGSLEMVGRFVPELLGGLPEGLPGKNVRIVLCPPLPYLVVVGKKISGSGVELGAQRVHPKSDGAYTGEVSPAMLKDLGVRNCIIGHSERRHYFEESDAYIGEKLHALIAIGIDPILCVGETLKEREAGRQREVVAKQLRGALKESTGAAPGQRRSKQPVVPHEKLSEEGARRLIMAYEPVWAIGTGRTPTPEQANAMHGFIRGVLKKFFSEGLSRQVPILYGGSVTPDNAGALMAQPDIDGALVGGASLKAASFLSIIEQALN